MPGTGAGRPGGALSNTNSVTTDTGAATTASRAQTKEQEDRQHVHKPFAVSKPSVSSGQKYGADRSQFRGPGAIHAGTDYAMPSGTALYAMVKSKIVYAGSWAGGDGKLIQYQALEDRGSIKSGDVYGYGSNGTHSRKAGDIVNAGDQIGTSGSMTAGEGVHFNMQRPAKSPGTDGNTDGSFVVDYAYGGSAADGSTSTSPDGGSGYQVDQIAKAAAFSTILSFPSAVNSVESNALTGQRSLLNDEPLFPFIEQICGASLRSFMSMPNGKFYAFYPDYFGGFGRQPYWNINDIEIMNGRIDLSDDTLATHVFVIGDTMPGQTAGGETGFGYGTVDFVDEMNTTGVINIFNAFQTGFLNGLPDDGKPKDSKNKRPDQLDKEGALRFLSKYGARKYKEPVPAVRSPIYETFLAFQRFCLLWASQFKTSFEFTFMPELFPGGIVAFPDHGLQCYVDEVMHSGSYEEGFTTVATLSAPAALKQADADPGREWIHSGMVRAFVNSEIADPVKQATQNKKVEPLNKKAAAIKKSNVRK